MIKKVIFSFSIIWLLLKNGNVPLPPKKFFFHFLQKYCFLQKKLLDEKIFKTSFPIKKVVFIFVAKRPLCFKRDLDSRNGFLAFSQKIQLFLKKLLNNKIFSTSFVIKKSQVYFWGRLLSLNNRQMYPKTVFQYFFQKYRCFLKNWRIK